MKKICEKFYTVYNFSTFPDSEMREDSQTVKRVCPKLKSYCVVDFLLSETPTESELKK